jgi:hypothetical protein
MSLVNADGISHTSHALFPVSRENVGTLHSEAAKLANGVYCLGLYLVGYSNYTAKTIA